MIRDIVRWLLVAVAVAFFYAISGCAALDRARAGRPDLTTPSGVGVYWHGAQPVAAAPTVIEKVHAAALAACPSAKLQALASTWRYAMVFWELTDPFWCGRWVHGCNPLRATVDVATAAVIPDELGHVVWQQCFGRSGEVTKPDGSIVYDQDFEAWIHALEAP